MDTPRYVVLVTLHPGTVDEASLVVIQGESPDPDEDLHLADGLTYSWGFEGDLVPGQLEPATASITLLGRTAADLPEIGLGDMAAFAVFIGPAISTMVDPPPMRVTSVEVDLDQDQDFVATMRLGLTDTLADLNAETPTALRPRPEAPRFRWRPRLAELAHQIGRSIGAPTWWADDEGPAEHPSWGTLLHGLAITLWAGSARDMLTALLNSHQPGGYTHTAVPGYPTGSWTSGYDRVGPTTWDPNPPDTPITEPVTDERYYLVKASRKATGHTTAEIDAAWCDIPAKARKAREQIINVVRVQGETATESAPSSGVWQYAAGFTEADDPTDRAQYGPTVRDLPTQLWLGYTPIGSDPVPPPAPAIVAANFLSDASVRSSPWVYDKFQLVSSRIPQATADTLLPYIAPRFPGATDGDDTVLRHLTLTNLDTAIDFDGDGEVSGFLVRGSLTVTNPTGQPGDGDLIWNLTLTPGEPT